ncbi:UDP-N-acetylmuramoyl-L-alanyl-D-glutamate--2,6-diaminopimelate ligase [Roseibium sp. TrichSKD4]|uniref:UDP-N-acetylmuramoyl-L-alanyl-D-glutamate--2, 6-diaminopimelate ligase n=1 Tax=Roseibium sp. TrichSKD4 TaxID=744980 RepID=UPI0001E5696F|nr:UDP-N-acetylmuramoyl-L-alanyl-D-glutamate--2,6-diaminopimelate ligase [Roseibium sp. TrichSKD4]EFO31047.1 UDP-N-acetylmuramoyl-L-alanyl-D-glutamate--2,6-diaminopimelate ligase [Roseibium sp. TrichSKD4]
MLLSNVAAGQIVPAAGSTVSITGLTADSRAIKPGFLFAALKGTHVDGADFAAKAVGAGAVAVLCERDAADRLAQELSKDVVLWPSDNPRRDFALMAARFHGAQPEVMVAVTGTSGKTSVAHFVRQIFQAAGHASASLGTIGTVTADGQSYGGLTTPDPVSLHAELARLSKEGITHTALEASSHGLDQHRLDGVRLVAAGFTNLGRDHMDYHPTVEDYLQAKLRLFRDLLLKGAPVVVEPSEPYADRVIAVAQERGLPVFSVGEAGENIRLAKLTPTAGGQELVVEAGGQTTTVLLPLIGRFQVSNALVAAGLCICAGVAPDEAIAALAELKGAPGRLEFAGRSQTGGTVYIDYAHKPDALENALAALRPFASGQLSVVIGAGGDRDPGKREIMGRVSQVGADLVIVTDDNPRTEDPATIRKAVLSGAPGALEIGDRREAIREGVRRLKSGDILCVAGKGHETGQIIGQTVHPFSDHEAVAEALAAGETE